MTAPTWSLADTHCAWCGKPTVTAAEWERHDKDPGPCGCDGPDCWCAGYCWRESNPHSCQVGPGVVLGLRGLVEAQAAVIARYKLGWRRRPNDPATRYQWWHYGFTPLRSEPMTPAEQQVLYGTTSEETTP